MRQALNAKEKNIATMLFQTLSVDEKYNFIKQEVQSAMDGGDRSEEDFEKLIDVMTPREKLGLFIEATSKNDLDTAVLFLTDTPEYDQLSFIVTLAPEEQQKIVHRATPSQLLHLLPRAHPLLQSEIINRLANNRLDDLAVALIPFNADKLREIFHHLPADIGLVNKFLGTITEALPPEIRVDLFCKLPHLQPLNKLQLVRGINFSSLPEPQQQALKPALYAEFEAGYKARDVSKILRALEILPWANDTHLRMIEIAVRGKGRDVAFAIIDMIPTKMLSQKDIAPLLGRLNDFIGSTQPEHSEIASRLSKALKSQRITDQRLRENIASIAQAAREKGGTMTDVAANLEEWRTKQ